MNKYRGSNLVRVGLLGAMLIILVITVGMHTEQLRSLATDIRYHALFTQAGGLIPGNSVTVAGIKVGTVQAVSLQDGDALVTFSVGSTVPLGSDTTAHIRTGTLLGERVLTLNSAGSTSMRPCAVIPTSRTSSPYSLSEAVSDLTTNTEGTDTGSLNQSLDTLSQTIDQVAPELGPTFDGLTKLSRSLNGRNDSLGDLLKHTADVSEILGERSERINTLILNAHDLIAVLDDRRLDIANLLANTSVVAQQLGGLIADNEKALAPTLQKLNSVSAMLEKNRDNIAKAIPALAKFELSQGESVSNAAYYNAYIPNIIPGQFLQPFLDYAVGFRRGVDAGQPPDNAGPRAEFPLPRNGIPQQQPDQPPERP